jgi:signal peptidase I
VDFTIRKTSDRRLKNLMKRKKIILLSIIIVILFSACLYALLSFRLIKVPVGAMKNTILPGDRLVVNKQVGEIKRGDLITFQYPGNHSILYLSRVIGLPGETIEIRKQKVYINGTELAERRAFYHPDDSYGFNPKAVKEEKSEGEGAYTTFNIISDESDELDGNEAYAMMGRKTFGLLEPFQIPQGHYFVLGDNRDDSEDSRFWGTVARELITGKPFMIYDSIEKDDSGKERTRSDRILTKVK